MMTTNNKLIIIINGAGGSGKDTICDIVGHYYKTKNVSSVDPIKSICFWGGYSSSDKSPKGRKLISDVKKAFVEYNDLPTQYLLENYEDFIMDENEILFLHIREPSEIEKFKQQLNSPIKCFTLLVQSKRTDNIFYNNTSDDDVQNYSYDFTYHNDVELPNLEENFMKFFIEILEEIVKENN